MFAARWFPPYPALSFMALALASACGAPLETGSPDETPASYVDLDTMRLVDLSYAYDQDTLYWPTSPSRFELTRLNHGVNEAGYFYSANTFCTPEHGGTHLDAPVHFAREGWPADEIPLSRLIGPGIVLDVSQAAAGNPDYALSPGDVGAWEEENGTIPGEAIVLLRTGWGQHWPVAESYLGDDTPGDASSLHFPSYGVDAARLLVEERRVAALGVDTASIDVGTSTDFMVHRVANGANVAGLENVARLEELPARGFWIVALPMKIAGGSGGPVRIVALLPP